MDVSFFIKNVTLHIYNKILLFNDISIVIKYRGNLLLHFSLTGLNNLVYAFATVDDKHLSIKGAGSSGLFEAGVGVDFDRNNHADFKLNYANGQKTEQKFGASLNYRYSW